jgi:hypothetical protein
MLNTVSHRTHTFILYAYSVFFKYTDMNNRENTLTILKSQIVLICSSV